MTPEEYRAHVEQIAADWPPLTAAQILTVRRALFDPSGGTHAPRNVA